MKTLAPLRSRLLWLVLSAVTLSCPREERRPSAAPLTSLYDLKRFSRTVLGHDQPLEVHGVVTFFDAARSVVYLQDSSGALALDVGQLEATVATGDLVVLKASVESGSSSPRLRNPRLEVRGQSSQDTMPEPRRVTASGLRSREAEAEWIEVHGVVRRMTPGVNSVLLELMEQGQRFHAVLFNVDPAQLDSLVDSRVRLNGVNTSWSHAGLRNQPGEVLVPFLTYQRIEADPPLETLAAPAASVRTLLETPPAMLPEHRVHVRGAVRRIVGERSFVLATEGHEVTVAAAAPLALGEGEEVDVAGFANASTDGFSLEESLVRLRSAVPAPLATPSMPLLTTAEQVRRLSAAEAAKGYPIQLQAVVTFSDPETRVLFVQDATAGIYVEAWRHLHDVRTGDQVEVRGRSAAGAFAPIVNRPRVRVLGQRPLPLAQRVRPEQLGTGQEDSQWVEVEAVARSLTLRRQGALIEMAVGGTRFSVAIPKAQDPELAARLVDARVRVRGVCRSILTRREQLAGVEIDSPDVGFLTVLTPAPTRPFERSVQSVSSLLQFNPQQDWEHRVHVRGILTFARGRDGEFFVRDQTGGVFVTSSTSPTTAGETTVGEEVDVIGFATASAYSPMLEDADVRSIRRADDPAAHPITPEQAMTGQFDSELVRLEARLVETLRGDAREGKRLLLQAGPYLFTAVLPGSLSLPASVAPGSALELTGVCVVAPGAQHVPQGFRLVLRSPADIRVLRAAPWWTPAHAAWLLGAMVALAAVAFAWVVTLRRRVKEQSLVIWHRVKKETELRERQRMARELHDSLEQNLTGISLSLEAARLTLAERPRNAEEHLARALEGVEASVEEVHRSVWALREETLETRGLAASLDEAGQQLAGCSHHAIEVTTRVQGSPRPLAVPVENNLQRIGQEALTNAVKHGKATHIEVYLQYEDEYFRLRVSDDGSGFDATAAPPSGHYGLLGMRERAHGMGARVDVRSSVGRGTVVEVTVPLPPLTLRQAG
jgi:signal transduction histidine kinase